ncbi:hypothetical protein SS50377_28640 [Spironucleus salmonicida]|uniref:Uncharacterized protein n=1 Tax=Spironucleus salmonicida TaxID=348837 RepID=V6LAU7_9EUKA|nr:hypothetical protein SS50377_28640 [Spironucleus salmonicida]|eukprot:EST41537.1 Hypothetical protein SS50377_18874 [Spironucleus salmonicida]
MELPDDFNNIEPQQLDQFLSAEPQQHTVNVLPHQIQLIQLPEPQINIDIDIHPPFEYQQSILNTNNDDEDKLTQQIQEEVSSSQSQSSKQNDQPQEILQEAKNKPLQPVQVVEEKKQGVEQHQIDNLNPLFIGDEEKRPENPSMSLSEQINQVDSKFSKNFDKFESFDIIVEKETQKIAQQHLSIKDVERPKISVAKIIDDSEVPVTPNTKKGCCAGM